MDNVEFDRALIAAAFDLAAQHGWTRLRVADAARAAGLPLARARARFACRGVVLLRFGRLADQAALAGVTMDGLARDRLFDMLMRRLDMVQVHRAGMLALLRALPVDPAAAGLLGMANLCSMRWMLDGAGIASSGPLGLLRAKGLLAVWLWTLRAWQRDNSEDLSASMAALDHALTRAGQAESWLPRRREVEPPPAEGMSTESGAGTEDDDIMQTP
jgi:ubiquinone biosynthesis protein COQ9